MKLIEQEWESYKAKVLRVCSPRTIEHHRYSYYAGVLAALTIMVAAPDHDALRITFQELDAELTAFMRAAVSDRPVISDLRNLRNLRTRSAPKITPQS